MYTLFYNPSFLESTLAGLVQNKKTPWPKNVDSGLRNDYWSFSSLVSSLGHWVSGDNDNQCYHHHCLCKNPPSTQAQHVPHNKPDCSRSTGGCRDSTFVLFTQAHRRQCFHSGHSGHSTHLPNSFPGQSFLDILRAATCDKFSLQALPDHETALL